MGEKIRQIGDTFTDGDARLKVCEQKFSLYEKCKGCYYLRSCGYGIEKHSYCSDNKDIGGECAGKFRPDRTNVVFKRK